MAHKNGRQRNSESGGALVQLRKREEERNPDMDPRLRAFEKFRRFFNPACREGYTRPKRVYGREVCTRFHSKVDCVRDFSRFMYLSVDR